MNTQTEPIYYATVTFAGLKIELWRTQLRTIYRWYTRIEGQTEDQFLDTRAESGAESIGRLVLNLPENRPAIDRIWD